MTIATRVLVILGKDEVALGVDSLAGSYSGGTWTDLDKAQAVLSARYDSASELIEETEIGDGSKSQGQAVVGRGSSDVEFEQQLRGIAGFPTGVPDWTLNLLATGARKVTPNKIGSNLIVTGGDQDKAKLHLGEQVFGQCDVTDGDWYTDTTLGATISWGAADTPAVGDTVVFFESDADNPIATGEIATQSGSAAATQLLIKLDDDQVGRPLEDMYIEVTNASAPAEKAYQQLTSDMPIGIVCRFVNNLETPPATTGLAYVVPLQGTFTGCTDILAQRSGVGLRNIAGALTVADHGSAWLPDSTETYKITTGSWTGTPPVVGEIVVVANDPSNLAAAAKVVEVVSATEYRITPRFGSFLDADEVYVLTDYETLGGHATQSGDAEAIGSPSRSFHYIESGFRRRCIGARGDASITMEAGRSGRIRFRFQGSPGAEPDEVSHPTDVTLPVGVPVRWEGGLSEWYGRKFRSRNLSMSTNNTIGRLPDANSDEGTLGSAISERAVSVSLTVHRSGIADPWEQWRTGAEWVYGGATLGTVEDRIISVVFPKLQVNGSTDSEEQRIRTVDVDFRATSLGGDDEFILATL